MITYTPQPGTIPARVLEVLKAQPPGTEMMSAVLLEAIGQPPEFEGFTSCMRASVEAGLIEKRIEGRRAFWKLPRDESEIIRAIPPQQDGRAEEAGPAPVQAVAAPKRSTKSLPKPSTCTEPQTPDFACGLFSDGRLVLELPDRTVMLKPEWTDKLMKFLRRAPEVSA